jgi:hypothetical protein
MLLSYTYSAYKVLSRAPSPNLYPCSCIIVLRTDKIPASTRNIQSKPISYETLDCTEKESLGRSGPQTPCRRDGLSGAASGVGNHLTIQMMIYLHATY